MMATVMMSPMPQDLPDWLMTWASLAPELSVTWKEERGAGVSFFIFVSEAGGAVGQPLSHAAPTLRKVPLPIMPGR